MDSNRHVLEWDFQRYGIKIDLDKDRIYPNSVEANTIASLQASYTAFRNMLRYSKSMPDYDFNHSTAEAISWDPDMEYIKA